MSHARFIVFALILGVGTVGCSSSDKSNKGTNTTQGDDDDDGSQASDSSVTVEISAEKGGTVKLGDAALKIPAGALGEDLEVTLETAKPSKDLPAQDTLTGKTYDFGPNGTKFEKAVELTLPLEGKPDADHEAVISWYDEKNDAWVDLAATVKDGVVVAEVEHFTLFIVRFRGVEKGAFDCGFEPCGGKGIEGKWDMAGACIDTGKQENPFGKVPACADAKYDLGVDAEGEVTFDAGKYDYHWTITGKLNLDLSSECLAAVSGGQACEAFKPGDDVVCVTSAGHCTCEGLAGDPDESMGTGTYEVSGDTITMKDDDEAEGSPSKICVKGDTAKIQSTEEKTDDDTGMTTTQTTMFVITRAK